MKSFLRKRENCSSNGVALLDKEAIQAKTWHDSNILQPVD